MSHERAFLDAIRAEPDDATHRLVFADWLDDRGDPRGPFIRCQVRAEQLPACDPARLALEEEAADLLERHRGDWLTDLAGVTGRGDGWSFRGGFLDALNLRPAAFLALPDRLFERHPIRSVVLIPTQADDLADVAACPHLRHLERLTLSDPFLADGPVEALLASRHLTRLRALDLAGTYITGRWLGDLAKFQILGRIEELSLSHCPFLHDRAVRTLVASRQAEILRGLRLGGTAVTPFGLTALLAPFKLRKVVDLAISVLPAPALAPASDRALRELAASPAAGQLTTLSLAGPLDGPRAERLFAAPFREVRDLALSGCGLTGLAVQALARAPHLRSLAALKLSANHLTGDDLAVLARSPVLAGVERLDLRENRLSGRAIAALAELPDPIRLAYLDLAGNGATGPGVEALVRSPVVAGLRELNLDENRVGPVGLAALATSPTLTGLTDLRLRANGIDAAGVAVLAGSPNLRHLRTLHLADNPIGDAGVQALAASPHLGRLRRLDLRAAHIGKAGIDALASSTTLPRLDALDLADNEITRDEQPRLAARFGGRVAV